MDSIVLSHSGFSANGETFLYENVDWATTGSITIKTKGEEFSKRDLFIVKFKNETKKQWEIDEDTMKHLETIPEPIKNAPKDILRHITINISK